MRLLPCIHHAGRADKILQQARIPEVSFHSLASHLSSASTAEAISTIGSVIVRDVIPDAQAEQAARETLVEISQRGGQNVYWADALLGLRSDPSILSANNQLLRALSALPNGETVDSETLILASGLQPGIENPGSRSTILSDPWAIDEKVNTSLTLGDVDPDERQALHPATPLVAHLALTKATGQAFQLPASIHASIYATLRPLFRHKRSKISFYSTSAYLDPVNWDVVSHDSIPSWSPSEVPSFPHLLGASVEVPTLRPGDVLYRNAGIPVPYDQQSVQEQDQVFLPVTPLPRNQGNVEYTNKQREAFEKGVPPPHALQGEESLVSLELGGGKNRIGSAGGRSAMGY